MKWEARIRVRAVDSRPVLAIYRGTGIKGPTLDAFRMESAVRLYFLVSMIRANPKGS